MPYSTCVVSNVMDVLCFGLVLLRCFSVDIACRAWSLNICPSQARRLTRRQSLRDERHSSYVMKRHCSSHDCNHSTRLFAILCLPSGSLATSTTCLGNYSNWYAAPETTNVDTCYTSLTTRLLLHISNLNASGSRAGETAIMALGVDDEPSAEALTKMTQIDGIIECGLFKDL